MRVEGKRGTDVGHFNQRLEHGGGPGEPARELAGRCEHVEREHPQPDGAVGPSGRDCGSVRAERQSEHRSLVAAECGPRAPGPRVPHPDPPAVARGRDELTGRGVRDRAERVVRTVVEVRAVVALAQPAQVRPGEVAQVRRAPGLVFEERGRAKRVALAQDRDLSQLQCVGRAPRALGLALQFFGPFKCIVALLLILGRQCFGPALFGFRAVALLLSDPLLVRFRGRRIAHAEVRR